jgi:thioredoxin 1
MSLDDELERIQRRKLEEIISRKSTTAAGSQQVRSIPAGVVTFTDENLVTAIEKRNPMVVDFWAPWCAPCRVISPVIEQLAEKYAGRVAFGKVNVDENPSVASLFQVQSIPTIMLFGEGRIWDAIVGVVPSQVIESRIVSLLNQSTSLTMKLDT